MATRGVRGATTVEANEADRILTATRELLQEMATANSIEPEDIAAIQFTATADLDAAFPAKAARDLGWLLVPLMDAAEIAVPGSLPRCIRVLLLWNTDLAQGEITHVYRGEAGSLRPDLADSNRVVKEGER
jgi:chorismate mutase